MLVFVLLQRVPAVLLLALAGMVYLTVMDVRDEEEMDFQQKVWWVLLVVIFNVLGFLAAKLYLLDRRRRRARPR